MRSITELPTAHQNHCEVFINDRYSDIVTRNAILLLTALRLDHDAAVEAMIHLWYSALIPQRMLYDLRGKVLPLIEDVCTRIQAKPPNVLLSKSWEFGTRKLRLVLQKDQWASLPSYLEVPTDLSPSRAHEVRASTTMAPERSDYLDRALCT